MTSRVENAGESRRCVVGRREFRSRARPGLGLGISRAVSRHAGRGDICASSGTRVAVRRDGRRSRRGGSTRAPSAPRRNLAPGRALSVPANGKLFVCRPPLRDRAPTVTGRVGITGAAPRPTLVPVRQRARLTRNASSRTRTFYFANITSRGLDETRKIARRRPTRRRARRGGGTARRETRDESKSARTVRKRARWRADAWQTLPGVSARKDGSVSSKTFRVMTKILHRSNVEAVDVS